MNRRHCVAIAATLSAALLFTSCGKVPSIPGLADINVAANNGTLTGSFVATALNWDTGVNTAIPGLTGAQVYIGPDLQTAGVQFRFSMTLDSLVNQGKNLPLLGLPDGRALPDVEGGVLPRWDVKIKTITLSFYLSNDAFAVWVPLKLSVKNQTLTTQVSVEIDDEHGNLLGKAYAIPTTNAAGSESGLFILLPYIGGSPPPT